ncbi:GntR family transcriptional regulator [Curvibacter sp. RS43]|uniref:GntR family transcriptional regulator n=1 Tax=Curvibacter microcysteis TaxID=3026419 RepID=UPI00235F68A7|nr:GntR family transcriptional regulator [Curvibacter sp. RS43]MDD0811334.1 GntR family transcriptional regulator [Curvibacter sp. RS43]
MNASTHSQLARELAEAIAAGRHPVGSLLPTEIALCEQHGLSRYAVRRALDQLQELGLISRRKNVGTRVEATQPATGFTQSIATVDDLAQFGAQHTRVIRGTESVIADLALAHELGCAGGSRWLRISSLRMTHAGASVPLCWTDVYVDEAFSEVADLVKASPETLISSLIEKRYGRAIARIRQDIQAIALPAALAEALQADAGTPALQIVRRYFDGADAMLEISRSIHPAQRFTFSMEMQRNRD